MMKKTIYFLIVILLIALIVISSYFIYKQLKTEKEQEHIFEKLNEIVQDNNENNSKDNLSSNSDINLTELYVQNNDLIGWIKIDNTSLDYPVMQTKDRPEYYLKRNFNKEYSSYGTPFLAEECNLDTSENLIVYSHHMKNSKMFGILENYKDKQYYDNHKIIKFYTLDGIKKYEIFAVFKTKLYESNTFKYYQNVELDSQAEYSEFIKKCCSMSFYDTGIIPNYKDKLITLSTCEYSAQNSRLVVVAKQII